MTPIYSRTQNEKETYYNYTRCLDCFLTVASAVETKEDLEQVECNPRLPGALSELLAARTAIKAHAQKI